MGSTSAEYLALVTAALVLIIVLIASFMCIQLYNLRKPTPSCGRAARAGGSEGFSSAGARTGAPCGGEPAYAPACGPECSGRRRRECRGATTGVMPSIETAPPFSQGLCCGFLGVPP